MLLYSLRTSYENFRCAIESRDDHPSTNILRIKTIEEREAWRHVSGAQSADFGASIASHHKRKNASWNSKSKPQKEIDDKFKINVSNVIIGAITRPLSVKSQRQSTPDRKQENVGLLTST
ncbi:hypothetical protein AVEN_96910-1 [Araneus ventricosus]|uniref:Uncharacterized protein n=1 Tax=Araneus ventricosus TaxID=182803 RepID=A0A4Y2FWR5_ARAVE|nr:hypothetical protein AVEN_96910-1 [Araneus ventricosus]